MLRIVLLRQWKRSQFRVYYSRYPSASAPLRSSDSNMQTTLENHISSKLPNGVGMERWVSVATNGTGMTEQHARNKNGQIPQNHNRFPAHKPQDNSTNHKIRKRPAVTELWRGGTVKRHHRSLPCRRSLHFKLEIHRQLIVHVHVGVWMCGGVFFQQLIEWT